MYITAVYIVKFCRTRFKRKSDGYLINETNFTITICINTYTVITPCNIDISIWFFDKKMFEYEHSKIVRVADFCLVEFIAFNKIPNYAGFFYKPGL